MTRLAIVSALHEELASVLDQMTGATDTVVGGRTFRSGSLFGHEVVAVLSRIGKVAAATTATLLAERFGVGAVVFTGVAGGIGPGVRVGDIVVASRFMQHDMDASPLFPRFEVPLYARAVFDTDEALTLRLHRAATHMLADPVSTLGPAVVREFGLERPVVHQGLVLSGDQFVSSHTASQALRQAVPQALAVEMEGAAFAQVCHDFGLPFAAVRTISDRADDEAHADFSRFIAAVASRYSLAAIRQLLQSLSNP